MMLVLVDFRENPVQMGTETAHRLCFTPWITTLRRSSNLRFLREACDILLRASLTSIRAAGSNRLTPDSTNVLGTRGQPITTALVVVHWASV